MNEASGQRLLDQWAPPEWAGAPIGCVATTYTFDAALFEEECLARFLSLDSDPQEDGAIFLIEREEKLASLSCAAVLADSRHARGQRSLRWDVLSVRAPGEGIQHAKLSLLVWERLVRIIVASANLSEAGYLRNQEVCGVLDLPLGGEGPASAVSDALDFLTEIVGSTATQATGASATRCTELIQTARERLPRTKQAAASGATVHFVANGLGSRSVLDQLIDLWPARAPADCAEVVSPFFDAGQTNRPAEALWECLSERGGAEIHFHTSGDERPAEQGVVLHAPQALRKVTPERTDCATYFYRIELADQPSDQGPMYRPLHAKTILLSRRQHRLLSIGSSNFTSAGLGLGTTINFEANLCYLANAKRQPEFAESLEEAFLCGEFIEEADITLWQPSEEGEDEEQPPPALPTGFDNAEFFTRDSQPYLQLHFGKNLPQGWQLYPEGTEAKYFDHSAWASQGRPAIVELAWHRPQPPAGLEVRWPGITVPAWWPVNVRDGTALPPVEELRELPLEVLIEILTSARSLRQVMRRILRRRAARKDDSSRSDPALDPHKRVDTRIFILQRTRRVSWAITGLCDKLARPVATDNALAWRLHGPVGADALIQALRREAADPDESVFLLAEVALELARIEPESHPGSLSPKTVRRRLQRYVKTTLIPLVNSSAESVTPGVSRYVKDVLKAVSQAGAA